MPIEKTQVQADNTKINVIGSREKFFLTVIALLLAIVIVFVGVFILYPKLAGRPDWQIMSSLDFNNTTWIEDMVNNRIKPTEKALDINSSFVYSRDTAFITSMYASSASIENARTYFLSQIPDSVDDSKDSQSKLNITGMLRAEEINVVNYEADVLNAYDVKVTIEKDKAEAIKQKLIREFPSDALNALPEITELMKSEKLGGYIMYDDDELSNTSYPGVPIFSEAYRYNGSKAELAELQKSIKEKYSNSIYSEEIGTVYFKEKGYVISLNTSQSDNNVLAVITVQKIPNSAKRG